MDPNVKIIMAYAIIAIGPIAGSYLVVKNSSKLTGALMGGFNKVGRGLSKAAGKFAQTQFKRGKFGQAWANRNAVLDDAARRRSIKDLEGGGWRSRLTGVGLSPEAQQVRSTYLADAKKQLDEREVAGHSSNLTKQAASMLASGYVREGNEWVSRDENGTIRKDDNGTELRVNHGALDVGTQGALDYAMKNNLVGSKNGSRAIAKSLVDTGEARMEHVERLASAIKDDGERVSFVENTRAAAQSAGLDQLKYMGVDANGNVDFAGVTHGADYKAPDPNDKTAVAAADVAAKETVAKKMSTSKLSGINKYAFDETDKTVVKTLSEQILAIEKNSPDRFKTELAGMGADGVTKMAKMIYRSGSSAFASPQDAIDHYAALHNTARAEHHSS